MNTLGMLVLTAATATFGMVDGFGKPHVPKALFRHGVVSHGPPPASGPISPPMMDGNLGAAGFGPGAGFGGNRRFANTTSQVFFVDPTDMQIGWQTAGPDGTPVYLQGQLTVPARYNFKQGFIYRLKLSNITDNAGLILYPTIEVAPSTPGTDAYLTHNPIPVQFTPEDIDQVKAGNFVTKVVYLPDPKFQELAVAGLYGAETLVSTRLEPGIDPILEADKRGTILMIVRVGAIDLEMPSDGTSGGNGGGPIYGDGGAYAQPEATIPPPDAMIPPYTPPVEEFDEAPAAPADDFPLGEEPPVSPVPADDFPLGEPPVSPVPADELPDLPLGEFEDVPTAAAPMAEPGVVPSALPEDFEPLPTP